MIEVKSAFWDKEILVNTITTGEHTELRVSIVQKNGKSSVSYREWYNTKNDPTWKPTKHGGIVGISSALYFSIAINSAIREADRLGWTK